MDKKERPAAKPKKPYVKPSVTQFTPEQAKPKLLGIINEGGEGAEEAKELLKSMFPEMLKHEKKSA
jgi:hypothetical protein